MVTPSSPEPSSEDVVPGAVTFCLISGLVSSTAEQVLGTVLLGPNHTLHNTPIVDDTAGGVMVVGDGAAAGNCQYDVATMRTAAVGYTCL